MTHDRRKIILFGKIYTGGEETKHQKTELNKSFSIRNYNSSAYLSPGGKLAKRKITKLEQANKTRGNRSLVTISVFA